MFWSIACFALGCFSCAKAPPSVPESQRLVDVLEPGWIEGRDEELSTAPRPTEWRFGVPLSESGSPTGGWQALAGVKKLAVRGGRLTGETTSPNPILRLVRDAGFDDRDPLHEIRLRMKAAAGTMVSVHLAGGEETEMDRGIFAGIWLLNVPLAAGEEMQTYTFRTPWAMRGADVRKIFVRPTESPGASFEIESVRLVMRREFLAAKPSGISWEGLSDVYRETVVARAGESIRWPLTLPPRPRLELALGALDAHPVTFRVALEADGETAIGALVSRTVTTPSRWEDLVIDLDELAGREVTLRLTLAADAPGTVGLWGSPVVRNRAYPRQQPGSGRRAASSADAPQGVIFILADTLRPDHLGFYGHRRATMPELARLAAEGAVFRDCVAQGAWTKVSAASLLTSLYPTTNGVRLFPDRVASSVTTLAEAYREAGYATLGFSSVLYTGKFSNLHQGYEELHESVSLGGRSKTARTFVDRLLPWLDHHSEVPFFVFLHVFDPHPPLEPDPPYDSLWADPAGHREHRRDKEAMLEFVADPIRRMLAAPIRDEVLAAGKDPAAFIERELAWYDGSIRGMDRELGRVFERLRELGLDRRTLVAFTSDHGEEFYDHGGVSHSHSVYGELIQVPLVLWSPGRVPPGAVIDETVQLIDVMPTLLELSRLPSPSEVQGRSLMPLLATAAGSEPTGGRWAPRPAISERPPPPAPSIPPLPAVESTALILDGWKLVRHLEPRAGVAEFELYDHRTDSLDQTDVAVEHPEVVERLAELMSAWRKQAAAERPEADAEAPENLSQEELERLRALGYLQ
ncbi:MAG: sulfatase [Thermoanaerobaculia bacterium]